MFWSSRVMLIWAVPGLKWNQTGDNRKYNRSAWWICHNSQYKCSGSISKVCRKPPTWLKKTKKNWQELQVESLNSKCNFWNSYIRFSNDANWKQPHCTTIPYIYHTVRETVSTIFGPNWEMVLCNCDYLKLKFYGYSCTWAMIAFGDSFMWLNTAAIRKRIS